MECKNCGHGCHCSDGSSCQSCDCKNCEHVKEWSDWKMKDWIKAGIVAVVVVIVISSMTGGAA